jgi:hypothetical protein
MLLAATIIVVSSRASDAQDKTPSPRMLLNLDLYAPQTGSEAPGPGTAGDDSMLQQLRALRAMGYLSPEGPLPDEDESDQPASPSPQPVNKSQGTQQ